MNIGVYQKIPEQTIRAWVADFVPRLEAWFEANPKRKICKVDWFYGRSIDLRRENYKEKIKRETERAAAVSNAEAHPTAAGGSGGAERKI